ncbi:DUF4410 domain-containing protein [Paraburkholderia sp. BL10I2N1]|uniref:DUF4410 domain-containing protein n=1 Tax=Paraburkholderia sp. BL10I2N1 TaxID=1938796 RepID=UPI0010619C8C|nr:DUF4410 domain-containing protein [Paraburkholderia sp. BL10I2N1]TDN61165.1 uncharacterized protein DUF4410 [Paraburkholderia sp. BL10I2N1]
MFTSLEFVARKLTRLASAALVAGSLLLAGCAGGVTDVSHAALHQVRPDTIYVYFDSSPDQVKLDSGMARKLKARFAGASEADEQDKEAVEAREQVANEIVRKLQSMGLHAERSDVPAPANQNALLVEGSFQTIDAGNRRRRMLIGLGAGKSEVGASVQLLYKPAGGSPVPLQSFAATADSGKAPGVVETAGVGAAAGHVATAAAMGAGLHAATEAKHDSIPADAKRLADSIAKQVAALGAANGWVPAGPVD